MNWMLVPCSSVCGALALTKGRRRQSQRRLSVIRIIIIASRPGTWAENCFRKCKFVFAWERRDRLTEAPIFSRTFWPVCSTIVGFGSSDFFKMPNWDSGNHLYLRGQVYKFSQRDTLKFQLLDLKVWFSKSISWNFRWICYLVLNRRMFPF